MKRKGSRRVQRAQSLRQRMAEQRQKQRRLRDEFERGTIGAPDYVQITMDLILQGRTGPGGWKKPQLALLGVPFPPYKDWQTDVITGVIPQADAELFVALRGKKTKPQVKALIREEA